MPNIAYFCAMVLRTHCTGHCSGLYGKYGIPVRGGGCRGPGSRCHGRAMPPPLHRHTHAHVQGPGLTRGALGIKARVPGSSTRHAHEGTGHASRGPGMQPPRAVLGGGTARGPPGPGAGRQVPWPRHPTVPVRIGGGPFGTPKCSQTLGAGSGHWAKRGKRSKERRCPGGEGGLDLVPLRASPPAVCQN